MSALTLDGLAKSYGNTEIVRAVTATVRDGEFVSLVGPSGCGKTTILRMVAGLVQPTSGRILLGTDDITQRPPNKRGLGLVFQSYALFPHLTVFENVAFGLRRQKVSEPDISRRVTETLAMVRLEPFARRYPRQLSGGQQQRVAIARAIAPRPRVLLFDEPLSNLDAQLRDEMQIELKRLQRNLGITTVFVTHDQAEALSLADRVCVMSKGLVQQFATPEDLYRRPATSFVAGFIGKPNKLHGTVEAREGEGGTLRLSNGALIASNFVGAPSGTAADIFIRQEAIRLNARDADTSAIEGTIQMRSFNGARVQYVVHLDKDVELIAEAPSSGPAAVLPVGAQVALSIDAGAVFALPPQESTA